MQRIASILAPFVVLLAADALSSVKPSPPKKTPSGHGQPDSQHSRLLMVETRDLKPVTKWPTDEYWKQTAVINFLYSKKHRTEFKYIHLNGKLPSGWRVQSIRPSVFESEVSTGINKAINATKRVGLYLDSDAIMANTSVPLEQLFENIAKQICPKSLSSCDDVGVAVELEEGKSKEVLLNTGIILFDYSKSAQSFFHSWQTEQKKPEEKQSREQSVLEKLLGVSKQNAKPGILSQGLPTKVGLLRARTMNTPFGSFVKHVGGVRGGGPNQRARIFGRRLEEFGITSKSKFNHVLDEITSKATTYQEKNMPTTKEGWK